MIVYTFEVQSLTKQTINGVDDTILSVVWSRTGVDENGYRGTYKICTNLDVSGIAKSTTGFIEYSNLTKSDILIWIKSVNDMDQVDSTIDERIEESKQNLTSVQSGELPWEIGS